MRNPSGQWLSFGLSRTQSLSSSPSKSVTFTPALSKRGQYPLGHHDLPRRRVAALPQGDGSGTHPPELPNELDQGLVVRGASDRTGGLEVGLEQNVLAFHRVDIQGHKGRSHPVGPVLGLRQRDPSHLACHGRSSKNPQEGCPGRESEALMNLLLLSPFIVDSCSHLFVSHGRAGSSSGAAIVVRVRVFPHGAAQVGLRPPRSRRGTARGLGRVEVSP